MASLRRRHRPGHDQHALHRLRPQRARSSRSASSEHEQIYPRPGYVEHDPLEIWRNTAGRDRRGARDAKASSRRTSPPSASPTSARRRCSGTGAPASRCTTPSSGRTPASTRSSQSFAREGGRDRLREQDRPAARQLLLRPQAALAARHVPGARDSGRRAATSLFGTVDSWLVWNLTGGSTAAATSPTSPMRAAPSSWTSRRLAWDDEILALFDIPRACLPEIVSSSEVYGEATDAPRAACRSPASSATSRPPSSARPASSRARPRTPTAPAASC